MFNDSPQIIAYLSRITLRLYDRHRELAKAELGTELMEFLEVRNGDGLTEWSRKFFEGNGARGQRLLLVLGDSVVFQRTEPRANVAEDKAKQDNFRAMLPFDPEQRALVGVTTTEQVVLFGTNRALYSRLVAGAEQAEARVVGVVPAMAYGVSEPASQLTPTNVARFYSHKNLREQASFLRSA